MKDFNIKIAKADSSHIDQLTELWHENFGDNYEYINFFMKNKFPQCLTIIALCNGKIVASQYLMPVTTMEYGSVKKGYYLYALSVDLSFRNKGIGKMLVQYACNVSEVENSFIILCPASQELVSYYKKMGFIESCYVSQEKIYPQNKITAPIEDLTVADFESMRNTSFDNLIVWDKDSLDYVLKENKFTGGINIKIQLKDLFYVIGKINSGILFIIETNVSDKEINEITSILCNHYGTNEVIWTTPFEKITKTPLLYGMTYNLQKQNYYFNLILN